MIRTVLAGFIHLIKNCSNHCFESRINEENSVVYIIDVIIFINRF